VIEPGECGAGVHDPAQARHLLINTLASQVTMFPAACACHGVRHAPADGLGTPARLSPLR
jgi:hypothetical protein